MAPTVVGISADPQWTTDGTLSALLPSGLQQNDLLVLFGGSRLASATLNLVDGYTLRSTDNETTTNLTVELQAKNAGASESSPAFVSSVTTSQPTGASLVAVRGWSGTITDVVVTSSATASATVTFPAASVAVDGSLCLRFAFSSDNNNDPDLGGTPPSPPSGHTELDISWTQLGSDATIFAYVQDALVNVSGGAASASITLDGSDSYIAYTVIIAPAAASSPTPAGSSFAGASGRGVATHVAPRGGSGFAGTSSFAVARRVVSVAGRSTAGAFARGVALKRVGVSAAAFAGASATGLVDQVPTASPTGRCCAGSSARGSVLKRAQSVALACGGAFARSTASKEVSVDGRSFGAATAHAGASRLIQVGGRAFVGAVAAAASVPAAFVPAYISVEGVAVVTGNLDQDSSASIVVD